MISVKAPARICFFGDHQDYLGLPVIAGAINRFIYITAEKNSKRKFAVHLKDLDKSIFISLDADFTPVTNGDYLRSATTVLNKKGCRFEQGYDIEIHGDIPLNAGLSSSSALVVGWIRFLLDAQTSNVKATDTQIGQWAYEAEVRYFKQPGGLMDQYTIAQQGLIYIDTRTGLTEKLDPNFGKLIVAESGIAKKTLDVLQNGRSFQEKAISEVKAAHPDFNISNSNISDYDRYLHLVSERYRDHWYAAIHNYDITKRAKKLLLSPEIDQEQLGKLMNEHQHILNTYIKNTPREMTEMMHEVKNAGAMGTKTIGSGGGGCMVAMVNRHTKNQVVKAFLKAGAKTAYEVELVY